MYQKSWSLLHCSWDTMRDGCNYFLFWAIFCTFTPQATQKIKILKKWKKRLEISSFYTCVPKILITWCTVPEIWCATDGWTDGRKKWYIEIGAHLIKREKMSNIFLRGKYFRSYNFKKTSQYKSCSSQPENTRLKCLVVESRKQKYKKGKFMPFWCITLNKFGSLPSYLKVTSAKKLFFAINQPLRCNEWILYLK